MNNYLCRLLLVYVCLTQYTALRAQEEAAESCNETLCTCERDPSPAGMMISHVHPKNEWMISYRYMNMRMEGLLANKISLNGSDLLSSYNAVPDQMNMNMHMLMAMYGVSDRLTLMLMSSYNTAMMTMLMQAGTGIHHHHMNSSGLGDTKIYTLYSPWSTESSEIMLIAGMSLPSGSINKKGEAANMMYPGTRLPYSMQTGSGSPDYSAGFNLYKKYDEIVVDWQTVYTLRPHNNYLGYHLGNELSNNLWGAWQWSNVSSSSLRVEGSWQGALGGMDKQLSKSAEPSADPHNYGGTKINLYAGMNLSFSRGCFRNNHIGAEFGMPLIQNLNGIQMNNKISLYLSWSLKI